MEATKTINMPYAFSKSLYSPPASQSLFECAPLRLIPI